MEVVEISGYTRQEKFHIAKEYLLKKQYVEHKITKKLINITDNALYCIIDYYVREAGVRSLERTIINLIRKAQKEVLLNDIKTLKIDDKNIETYLGKKKYIVDKKNQFDEVGAALGLAWTAAGGDTLFCEAAVTEGTGKIEATGSLGDVMKESTKIAVTYIRTIYDKLGLEKDFYKTKDIHIHFPDGATPKDGPSAGITIALAVTSALTGRKIRCDVAMTGEISIRGKVLPIGGLKEKSISAHRVSVYNIIIPKENERDLEEIPKEIFGDFNFMPVSNFLEVLDIALLPKEEPTNIISVREDNCGKLEVFTDKVQ
jgi:ATP-dependent Lon protease